VLARGQEASGFLIFQEFQILSSPGVLTFSGNSGFWSSVIAARGLAANHSSGGEKNPIVYSLFCVFIIIVINISSIITSISISFVVVLNCLYLNLRVFLFARFSSPSRWGGRGGVSERLSGA